MGGLRCVVTLHSDLFLEWDRDFSGSISTDYSRNGAVTMKYSSVPFFIYFLAKPIGDLGFLERAVREEILKSTGIGFASMEHAVFATAVENQATSGRDIWNGSYRVSETGEERKIEEDILRVLRENDCMDKLIEILEKQRLDPKGLQYIGRVPQSVEFPAPVHVLSAGRETYVAHGMNVLKMRREQTVEVVKEIDRLYGIVVSSALKGLL